MKFVVFGNAKDGRDDEFNKWYDETHVPDVVGLPGVVSGARFRVRPAPGAAEPEYRYVAVYELDTDPESLMGEMGKAVTSGRHHLSDAADIASMESVFWEEL